MPGDDLITGLWSRLASALMPKLSFRLLYLFGWTPWDTGVTPPELVDVVEGQHPLEPTGAIDLGCGTGTNAVYLACHNWDVTAIDFTPRAVKKARRRVEAAGVKVRLLDGDVTRLDELSVHGPFRLFFDLGCFHGIPLDRRGAYARGITARAEPRALFMLWAFGVRRPPRPAITTEEVEATFSDEWEIVDVKVDDSPVRGTWYRLRRRDQPVAGTGSNPDR